MALSKDAPRVQQLGVVGLPDMYGVPVKAATVIYAGALVVGDAGYAAPGRAALNLVALGRCERLADNSTGAAGDITATVRRGIFRFKNSSAGDLIAQGDCFSDCYIVDDETVAKTSASSTRSRAGKVVAVDSSGVWVQIGVGY